MRMRYRQSLTVQHQLVFLYVASGHYGGVEIIDRMLMTVMRIKGLAADGIYTIRLAAGKNTMLRTDKFRQ